MIYRNEYRNEISFPLGGIGTGSIGLAGNGALIDFEIFNRPNKGGINPYTFFAVRAEYPDGRSVAKVLQGDQNKDLSGQYTHGIFSGFGYGPEGGTMSGFPHFEEAVFDGAFPMATLTFKDRNFPAEVVLRAYNPFIPHQADDSSLPAAFFDVAVKSREDGIKYTVLLSAKNPFPLTVNRRSDTEGLTAVTMYHADKIPEEKEYGDLTIAVAGLDRFAQTYWYRGGWQDPIATFWHELERGDLHERSYDRVSEKDYATVGCTCELGAGEEAECPFLLSWNVPNCYNYWDPYRDEPGRDVLWKNYYATLFESSLHTALYAFENRARLYADTLAFTETLHGCTLDPVVVEAVSSTLSVLKSPTVLRLQDGTFYGWEGVHEKAGSCEGTCTHVWSYAYALCFLFPELERSIRETEFRYDTTPDGKMSFRTMLPLGRGPWGVRACVDGQMASVIKTYREWKISGDDGWLKKHWKTVKSLIAYAWSEANPDEWDRDRDGVLEGRQHHTLDMEMFGPSAWLEGMYLAALKAGAEMAEHMGEPMLAEEYLTLFAKGQDFTKKHLFNGKYYIQQVDLRDRTPVEHFNCPNYWNEEKGQLKYQIGEGCEIDQLLGQWHANLCGLGDIFDPDDRKIALRTMYDVLFKPSMREMANAWRVFVLNDEGGTVMCEYPEGAERPVIPIPYSDECMTGFEYAFAGLLISEGFREEGLNMIRAIRGRYDGKKRNPWNEIECGSNYARAMASFALLPIFSGLTFDIGKGYVGFNPLADGDFRCIWSLGQAWGDFTRNSDGYSITVKGGTLSLSSLRIGNMGDVCRMTVDGNEVAFRREGDTLHFDRVTIANKAEVRFL